MYQRGETSASEWSYPTGENRWTTLVFENGKLVSRQDRTAPAFPPQRVGSFSSEEVAKRTKLRGVTIGMDIAKLDALGVTQDATMTSAEWKNVMDSKEGREALASMQSLGESMLGTKMPNAYQVDPNSFDEIRSFNLAGETLYVSIKDKTVVEVGIAANPDPKWIEQRVVEALASKKPTAADFQKIRPGMQLLEVVMTVGIPSSEDKVTTEDGTVTVMKYKLSRRQRFEIQVKDDVVTKVRTLSSY